MCATDMAMNQKSNLECQHSLSVYSADGILSTAQLYPIPSKSSDSHIEAQKNGTVTIGAKRTKLRIPLNEYLQEKENYLQFAEFLAQCISIVLCLFL